MLDDFLVRAVLGGVGVALTAGPLGCFVVWRRMAYFGGALAHSALLGVALGLLLALDLRVATVGVCVLLALLLALLQRQRQIATDTLLGVFAETSLALGLLALSFFETLRVDLMAYLFGDVLAVSRADLAWIWVGGAVVLALLLALWVPLLRLTLHQELAEAEGVAVDLVRLAFMLLIALIVAIGMKIVGILLIVALLVIPPAAARPFARTPEQMALGAAVLGAAAVVLGILASLRWDTPSGPSIVAAAAGFFALGLALAPLLARLGRPGA
jgi:zinc transport system permease protein